MANTNTTSVVQNDNKKVINLICADDILYRQKVAEGFSVLDCHKAELAKLNWEAIENP